MSENQKKKEPEEERKFGQVSRREFLRDAGLVVGGATIGSMAFLNSCKSSATATVTSTTTKTTTVTSPGGTGTSTVTVTSPGGTATVTVTATPAGGPVATKTVNLTVNGGKYALQVKAQDTLQHILHDVIGLKGTKTFCLRGACGSCTVIMGGRPVLSCTILAIECDGQTIQTSEGIANSGHPIVEAYIKHHCMQCGYCTPGFLVTAKALLDRIPNPTTDQVKQALAGNLCRCSTYLAHPAAVLEAAANVKGGT
jgi:aerobic-type carbon monoxide dehydrogenase small subunit (CoxS/CutS family)